MLVFRNVVILTDADLGEAQNYYQDIYKVEDHSPAHFLLATLNQEKKHQQAGHEKVLELSAISMVQSKEVQGHLRLCDLFLVVGDFDDDLFLGKLIDWLPLDCQKYIFLNTHVKSYNLFDASFSYKQVPHLFDFVADLELVD